MPALKDNDLKVKYIIRNFDHYRGFLPRLNIKKPFNSSVNRQPWNVKLESLRYLNVILSENSSILHIILLGTCTIYSNLF